MEKKYKNILPELTEYIGTARYDEDGTIIWAAKGEELQHLADVRGWGHLQNKFPTEQDAMFFQDAIGEFIADAINEKIERSKGLNYSELSREFTERLKKFSKADIENWLNKDDTTLQEFKPIELKNLKNPE